MSKPPISFVVARAVTAFLCLLGAAGVQAQNGQAGYGGYGYVGGYGAYGSDQWWVPPSDPNVERGNASLMVHNERANYVGLSLTGGTTYTLSYWAQTDAGTAIGVAFGSTVPGSGTFNDLSSAVTAGGYQSSTAADANWHQYFATITPASTSTNFEFGIDCRPASKTWWIDQVRLVATGATGPIVNLVQDGGFEAAYTTNFNGDTNDWPTEGWVNGHWTSEYNWDIFQFGNPTGPTALTIEGTPAIAHTGYASLLMNNARANYYNLNMQAGVTYNLSYWVQGYPGEICGVGGFATSVSGAYPAQITDYSSSITSGGYQFYTISNSDWNQYFATIVPAISATNFEFGIDIRSGPNNLDDVVLTEAGSPVNLVGDASFESAFLGVFPGANPYDPNGWYDAGWVDNNWASEYNWDTEQYGQPLGPEAMGISGTPAVVHSGKAALEVNYLSPRANYTGLTLNSGTTYTLTYWILSTEGGAPVGATLGTFTPGTQTVTDQSSAITAGGYASSSTPTVGAGQSDIWPTWHQYTATITPTTTATNYEFGIDCRPTASDFYIDDVALTAQGSAVNLVQDGGFEAAYQFNLNGDGNDWFAANWVDGNWFSEYASAVHTYGNPAGQQALYIQGTPNLPGSSAPPMIVSATRDSVTLDKVVVVYSEPVLPSTATNLANYAVNNGNSVTSATIDNTSSMVTLILANTLANGTTNVLTVNGVTDTRGATTIAPNTQVTITLAAVPLTLVSAARDPLIQNQVVLVFSVPVLASTATNVANYTVNDGNSVVSATLDSTLTNVTLILADGIANNVPLVITVNGVTSVTGGMTIGVNSRITVSVPGFTQSGQIGYAGNGYAGGYGAYGSDQWWVTPADSDVYRGRASLKVHNARANYAGLNMAGGITYTLSYWVKTDAGTKVGVTFGTTVPGSGTFNDFSSAVTAGGYQAGTAADANWHQYFATITPASAATDFEFGIDCRPASGVWWIDQVRLVEQGATGAIVNLVQDGGFEAAYTTNINGDATDWPTQGWVSGHWTSEYNWDIFQYGNSNGPTSLSVEGAPGIAHSGYASMLLNISRANYYNLNMQAGVTYNLSYWVQGYAGEACGIGGFATSVAGAYPTQITDYSSSITSGGYQFYTISNSDWNEYFATIVPSVSATNFEFAIDIRPGPNYIDDVTLTEAGSSVNLVHDTSFESASQNLLFSASPLDPNGWYDTGWIDGNWASEYNWSIEQYGQPLVAQALGISGTPAVVHSGNAALEVNYLSPRANYTGLTLNAGTTYTLSYWLLSTEGGAPVGATLGTFTPGTQTVTDQSSAITAGGYASSSTPTVGAGQSDLWPTWHQYTATITPTTTATNYEFGIDCRPTGSDFYIDDVALTAQGSTANLVQDGGFEAAYQFNLNGDGNDWFAANWVDGNWFSEYASAVHTYGNPAGQQALYIQGTPSSLSTITSLPPITFGGTAGTPTLIWSVGTLQSSTNVNGPYSDVGGASSPYTLDFSGSRNFYRVRQ